MSDERFEAFFTAEAKLFLLATIRIALSEDGPDLTSSAVFGPDETAQAVITAKQETIVCGLPLIPQILEFGGDNSCEAHLNVDDGERVVLETMVAALQGPAAQLLKAERVILNYLTHLSGIAELTSKYVAALKGTKTTLLDTRKTMPGLRYPEKYAVLVGGGKNHRKNLVEMLMLKDNHIDRAGSIALAVKRCRDAHDPCPPIEVECRNLDEVREAVDENVSRIMLDNMDAAAITKALAAIPSEIESEISGGVTLENIHSLAKLGPNYISVGRLTHSAPSSDFSMQILPK